MNAEIIDRGRGPEIAGTRITVYDVLDYLKLGWHHSAIAATLRLSSDEVVTALDYIQAHQEEVLADYQQILARTAQANSPEVRSKLDAARERLAAALKEHVANAEAERAGNSSGRKR